MEFCARSDQGRVRKLNQDSFGYFTADAGTSFFMVADGMGGHNAGEVASAVAVRTFLDGAKMHPNQTDRSNIITFIQDTFHKANDLILYKASDDPEFRGMGTTAVAAVVTKDRLLVGNLGDSRAYLISNGEIRQITEDHSYVALLLQAGRIDKEEARTHPRRNEITRALGVPNYLEPDFFELEYQKGDILILCSDGLDKMVDDAAILRIAEDSAGPDDICRSLTDEANRNGGLDNITVIAAVL